MYMFVISLGIFSPLVWSGVDPCDIGQGRMMES